MFTIKVQILGITEQRSVTLSGPTSARQIFKEAGIDTSGNYIFKLDGAPINLDDMVSSGNLLYGSAQIKGN